MTRQIRQGLGGLCFAGMAAMVAVAAFIIGGDGGQAIVYAAGVLAFVMAFVSLGILAMHLSRT